MSSEATTWAWQQHLPPPEKIVLLCLAEDANHQAQCWPAKALLIARTSLSETELAASLKALAAQGLLTTKTKGATRTVFLNLGTLLAEKAKPQRQELVLAPAVADEIEAAMAEYQALAIECGLPKVRVLTPALRAKLVARLKECGLEGWREALRCIKVSAHCRGFNDRKWKASFSFLLQATSFASLINGKYGSDYEEKSNGGQRTSLAGRGEQRVDSLRSTHANLGSHLAERGEFQRRSEEDPGLASVGGGGQAPTSRR